MNKFNDEIYHNINFLKSKLVQNYFKSPIFYNWMFSCRWFRMRGFNIFSFFYNRVPQLCWYNYFFELTFVLEFQFYFRNMWIVVNLNAKALGFYLSQKYFEYLLSETKIFLHVKTLYITENLKFFSTKLEQRLQFIWKNKFNSFTSVIWRLGARNAIMQDDKL